MMLNYFIFLGALINSFSIRVRSQNFMVSYMIALVKNKDKLIPLGKEFKENKSLSAHIKLSMIILSIYRGVWTNDIM